jgi:anti-sigma-K factor RskA
MALSEEAFHEIHQYLSRRDTPEEHADFEKRMRADQALAGEVAAQRRILNGLKANEYKNLFKDIHAQLENDGALPTSAGEDDPEQGKTIPLNPESRISGRWRYIAAAASILLAISLIWYFNSLPTSTPVASDVPAVEKPTATDTVTIKCSLRKPDTVKTSPAKGRKSRKRRRPMWIEPTFLLTTLTKTSSWKARSRRKN